MTQEVLEESCPMAEEWEMIQEFSPTMLLVEHDRAFQEAAASKIVQIRQ